MSDPQFIIDSALRSRSAEATAWPGTFKKPRITVHKAPALYDSIRQKALEDTRLSYKATALLFMLTSVENPTLESLSSLKREGRSAVTAAIEELERFGYLRRERARREDGVFDEMLYHVLA